MRLVVSVHPVRGDALERGALDPCSGRGRSEKDSARSGWPRYRPGDSEDDMTQQLRTGRRQQATGEAAERQSGVLSLRDRTENLSRRFEVD
jgi:hypothetical protein